MCAVFRGISIDQEMLRLVTGHGFRGTVHSVYDLVVNFYDQLGGLNCMVSHNLDNAPGTLRINLPGLCTFKTIGVMNGEPVRTKGGRMFLGSKIVIDLWKINIWQGVLPCFSPEAKQPVLSRNLQALKKVILACGLPGGIKAFYTGKKASEVRDFFSVELKKRAGNLMDALVSHNLPAAREAGLTLLGLGNGQTPSGDDFLAGLITVWNMPAGPFDSWYVELGKYLAAAARERTTLLSQATLEKAAKGYVREKVINLLTALSASMPVQVLENKTHGNFTYGTINEGLGKVLRYGAYGNKVISRLKWIGNEFAQALKAAVKLSGGIDIRSIIAQALHMGDECHNRL